jgi:hypothetical protein
MARLEDLGYVAAAHLYRPNADDLGTGLVDQTLAERNLLDRPASRGSVAARRNGRDA